MWLTDEDVVGDKHGKGKRNPKRIGANFHSNLRKLGQLDKDDPNW